MIFFECIIASEHGSISRENRGGGAQGVDDVKAVKTSFCLLKDWRFSSFEFLLCSVGNLYWVVNGN